MINETRRLELSSKLLQIGHSLLEEGNEIQDYTITQSGSVMLLISGLLLSDEDMFLFSEICSMFSAKKILDAAEGIDESEILNKFIKKAEEKAKTKKPRKPKKDNGENE